ncbi:P-loop containing nucleoside triphosphate hydrolase protein [Thelonectria olida]|uniref:P-loop containing nucleoside triphosphate hydrolase protein n=1 Tax=Thelonectria olida TaxID=1576542 RepID=A0A9P8WDF8_9HYPO|nr:P-loop containing nucleoside triphosphate hydrolase protein [Thelonectria olida]
MSSEHAPQPMSQEATDRIVPMRVIVCGIPRTGTLSIRSALRQLGLHDCYHMHTVLDNPVDAREWVRAFEAKYAGNGTFTRADWDHLIGDCQAVCDAPAAYFGPELAEAYPEAKIIILNRDPEAWYESFLESIYPLTRPQTLGPKLRMLYCFLFDDHIRHMAAYGTALRKYVTTYDHGTEKEKALAYYKSQYQEFHDRIPEDRRIEYTISEGWKPLCDFLGLPVPMVKDESTGKLVEAPFPRLNDRAKFQGQGVGLVTKATERANKNLLSAVGRLALTGVAGYAGYLLWKTRLGGRL